MNIGSVRVPLRAVVLAAVVCVLLVGVLIAREIERGREGDVLQVVAEVDQGCVVLEARVDDLVFQSSSPPPLDWRGRSVPGSIEVTSDAVGAALDGKPLRGVFRAEDGRTVEVEGGGAGDTFFELGCLMWPEDPLAGYD